jgi:FMN phosphatase YigB (HAD superfamily)
LEASLLRNWFDYAVIKRSGYFDPAYYRLHCSDCSLGKRDPLWHFVESGWHEGRNPSARFDTTYYLNANADINQAGLNPLVHYLNHGRLEGRPALPDQAPEQANLSRRPGPLAQIRKKLYNLGKKIYWSIPPRFRQKVLFWLYRHFGFLFGGVPNYRNWRNSRELNESTSWYQHNLVDIDLMPPARSVRGSIAIHIHIYYHEVAREFLAYLRRMPFPYDLYVSVANDEDLQAYESLFKGLPLCSTVKILRVPNRGRDVAPIFCAFGKELAAHDFIAHLHTKKSAYNQGNTAGWREYLCSTLFDSEERLRRIFALLQAEHPCGIVYPQNYIFLPYWANTWLANAHLGRIWADRLGLGSVPRGYFDYPASSMFLARTDALRPLFHAGITLDDFPPEEGQTDGTLAHCLERMFVLVSQKQGFRPAIIKDPAYSSWSAWRFDLYTSRTPAQMLAALASPQVKLIAFDIFDTLLCRPLLEPETVKTLVSRRAEAGADRLYLENRAIAEAEARRVKRLDVGLDEIFDQMTKLTRLPPPALAELRRLEEEIESLTLSPRPQVIDLYRHALATGKPVALVSDMFLPRRLIEKCLHNAGIDRWDAIFLSNEVGWRKDEGELYRYVLRHYGFQPADLLMVGDNERSDIQIPCDMGASFLHVLKPVELARSLPRLTAIIAEHERRANSDAELTLGLVLQKNFTDLYYPSFDPDSLLPVSPYNWGYSLVGPLLVSFADWILCNARQDGVKKLYFLSREGKIIQQVYDRWTEGLLDLPDSSYLVASRRAAGVAAISTFDDILNIARTVYYPNTLENFLLTRYGLALPPDQWQETEKAFNLGRQTLISVQNRQVKFLQPLLQSLQPQIMARAASERDAFLRYLEAQGLDQSDSQAVVDVGYGGSVQGYLNGLLGHKVHGYYMMTDERSASVTSAHQVLLRGCFTENVPQTGDAPIIYRESFEIEKLLSGNEAQVEYYQSDTSGKVEGHFRSLTEAEKAPAGIRSEIQSGALEYVTDARRLRKDLLPAFQPSCWTARMLMEAFLAQPSDGEAGLLSKLVLDDHYCGRDIVS